MANQINGKESMFKAYIAPICVALLLFGAIAIFAGFGGSSSGGSSGIKFPGTSSGGDFLYPLYSSTNFSTQDGYKYRPSGLHSGSLEFINEDIIRGNVLKYTKTLSGSGTGETLGLLCYDEEVSANKVSVQFDMYLDSSSKTNSSMSYQISLNELSRSPFILTIGTGSEGFNFRDMGATTGSITSFTTNLEYDAWHTIKIEADLSSTNDFNLVLYADGVEIGSTKTYNGCNAGNELMSEVSGIYFTSNSSVISTMKLDNVSLNAFVLSK